MKILLSVLVVAAIVTSAFAFYTKNLVYCVRNGAGTACQIVHRVENPAGPLFFHYPLAVGWDGTNAGCTQADTVKCKTPIHLIID
jgi:hypothetical protein